MLEPAKSIRFDSWEQLFTWLSRASEAQLMTIFVWASDQERVPAEQAMELERARRTAFEELVGRVRDRLRSYLISRHGVRDVHLVEDLVQETLVKVYTRAEQFDPQRSFYGWLFRIAHNAHVDQLRRKRPGSSGAGHSGEAETPLEKLVGAAASPESALLERERHEQLVKLIDRLPALQRRIVQRKLAGAKGIDIAREISRSPGYVSQVFHEAVEVIREQLGD